MHVQQHAVVLHTMISSIKSTFTEIYTYIISVNNQHYEPKIIIFKRII